MASSGKTEDEAILCERGCGFYGNRRNNNLCSQCYKVFLKEEEAKIEVALSHDMSSLTLVDENVDKFNDVRPVISERCMICNKKVGLLGFNCRCNKGMFCKVHRYPEEHACTFDFKSIGRVTLAKENPLCKADKLETRI